MLPHRAVVHLIVLTKLSLVNGYDMTSNYLWMPTSQSPMTSLLHFFDGDRYAASQRPQRQLGACVTAGAELAMEECGYQFSNNVWNCPVTAFQRQPSSRKKSGGTGWRRNRRRRRGRHRKQDKDSAVLVSIESPGSRLSNSREAALVNAILSAGVTHVVARNCSEGSLAQCGCDSNKYPPLSPSSDWKWGGCSDNLGYGEKISHRYLIGGKERKRGKSSGRGWRRRRKNRRRYRPRVILVADSAPNRMTRLHNNEAGRVALRKQMRKLCKCHGTSGACAMQTCWKQMGSFKKVGTFLKKQYHRALKIDYDNEFRNKLPGEDSGGVQLRNSAFMVADSNPPYSASHLVRSNRRQEDDDDDDDAKNTMSNRVEEHIARDDEEENNDTSFRPDRSSRNRNLLSSRDHRVDSSGSGLHLIKKRTLVFLQPSPNYCEDNPSLGYSGVLGRTCSVDVDEGTPDGGDAALEAKVRKCGKQCRDCGLEPVRRVTTVSQSCHCRFVWCCAVKCLTCHRKQIQVTCQAPVNEMMPANTTTEASEAPEESVTSHLLSNQT